MPKLKEFVVKIVARIAYRVSRTKRRRMEKNLSRALGRSLSKGGRQEIIKGAFYEFWRDTFALLPSRSERAAVEKAEARGLDYLYEALKNQKGAILWESSGFGRRFVAKQILHKYGFSVYQVNGPNNLAGFLIDNTSASWARCSVVKRLFENWEKRFVAEIINLPNSGSLAFTRILSSRLKQNGILCISGDGERGQKLLPIKFLGGTNFFSSGMVNLAKISGATILPMFCLQEEDGETRLIIESPIHVEPNVGREEGIEKNLTHYGKLLEAYVRRNPEQYRNWHLLGEFSGHST